MQQTLTKLVELHPFTQFLIFFGQNLFVFAAALLFGMVMLRGCSEANKKISGKEWRIAAGTVVINTLVTHLGFLLWQKGLINIVFSLSIYTLIDLLILFFAMDFLMYIFHWAIHKTILYKYIHTLHHEAIDPKPVDLFILHPAETAAFGIMWLAVLLAGTFNVWAIIFYLVLNVVFGIIGHLGNGVEGEAACKGVWRFAGTSRFHHDHHRNVEVNFGFYTNIWDRMFGTFGKK